MVSPQSSTKSLAVPRVNLLLAQKSKDQPKKTFGDVFLQTTAAINANYRFWCKDNTLNASMLNDNVRVFFSSSTIKKLTAIITRDTDPECYIFIYAINANDETTYRGISYPAIFSNETSKAFFKFDTPLKKNEIFYIRLQQNGNSISPLTINLYGC
jgi:hypothetical protein